MSFAGKIEPDVGLTPDCSFVIPFFNEHESLEILYGEIVENCDALGKSFELIFVDDGSNDGGTQVVRDLAKKDKRVSLLRFRPRSCPSRSEYRKR